MSATPMDPKALFSVEGKVIVVTGVYGRLGQAFARTLLDAGAKVAGVDVGVSAQKTKALFGEADYLRVYEVDVTDRAALSKALEQLTGEWGSPWGLVNNAALDSSPDAPPAENGPFETYPEASWDKVMDVNVKGVFLCCQVFGAAMAEAGGGSIVNIASIYGAVSPDQALYQYRRDRGEVFFKPVAYAASKSALYNLSRYVAVYWGQRAVRCNTLTLAGLFAGQDPAFLRAYQRKIPLSRPTDQAGRMAAESDYVGAVLFLLSPASGYMTGADLRVDGGFLAI